MTTKRRIIIVVAVVVATVAAFAAAYLTGLVIVGDPFSGTWGLPEGGRGALIVKRTPDGSYRWLQIDEQGRSVGWWSAKRSRNTLTSVTRVKNSPFPTVVYTVRFVFHPWNGRLLWIDGGGVNTELVKVSDATTPPSAAVEQ